MKPRLTASRRLVRKLRLLLDRARGLDFMTTIRPEDVGLDPKCARRSTPSGNKYLANVLRDLNVTPADSVVDVGCGKGSAMRTMLRFPFARVDGIELSEHIAAIATRNFKRLNASRATVFICDAPLFSGYDAYNVVYFYNPFSADVMSQVVDALVQSVRRSNRELVVIYNNAVCHDIVISRGVFTRAGVYPSEWGTGIAVYSSRDGIDSRLFASRRLNP